MKKIICLVLLIIIALSLISCTNAEYSEIINTSEKGKTPPELNISYDAKSKTLNWNKISGVTTYIVQIGEYKQTINGSSVSFRENIENGIYTVTITPQGYKSVTTIFTVGVKDQNSYMETIIFIVSISVLTVLLIISVIIIIVLKRNKKLQDKKIDSLSEKELTKKVQEMTWEKKEFEKKLLYSENALQEALNEKLKSEQKLEKSTQTLAVITSEKIDFKSKYLKAKTALKESEEALEKAEKENIKAQEDFERNLQKANESTKAAEAKAEKLQKDLSEAIIQIAELKNAPPKVQEKIVYKTIDNSKENTKANKKYKDFRKHHEANYRCDDGHYVRSKSERDIDNFFFNNNIMHIYESNYTDPITDKQYIPDFYLPQYNLYIEYFGLDSEEYNKKRQEKIEVYKRNSAINFDYLDYSDDYNITEKLQYICKKHNIIIK